MRIRGVTAHRIRIPFVKEFAHALHSRAETETVLLVVTSRDGETGIGEILPRSYLTGESFDEILGHLLPSMARRWASRTFESCDEVLDALRDELARCGRNLATFAGWESAILDVAGKTFGFTAGDVLGSVIAGELPTGVVIDFNIHTPALAKHCMMLRLRGHRYIKVKVGLADDLERLTIIADVLGHEQRLRLDANAAWSPDEAIARLRAMSAFNLDSVEQPVAPRDLAGMCAVREKTGVAVVADEAVCSLADAQQAIRSRAADIINVRMAKCGGLLGSREIVKAASEAGLRCYLGTLVGETGALLRLAEVFGQRVAGFDFLEGKGQNRWLLADDPVERLPSPQHKPGLALALDEGRLVRWQQSTVQLC